MKVIIILLGLASFTLAIGKDQKRFGPATGNRFEKFRIDTPGKLHLGGGTGNRRRASAVGQDGSNNWVFAATNGGLQISEDNGQTWTIKTTADGLPDWLVEQVFALPDKIFAGTYRGLAVSDDGGQTWTTILSGRIQSIYAIPPNKVYAVLQNGGLRISNDGGQTWVNKTVPAAPQLNSIFAFANNTVYVGTRNGLAISEDDGNSWVERPTGPDPFSNDVLSVFVSDGIIYAGTLYGLVVSADNAETWTSILPNITIRSVFVSDGIIYVTDGYGYDYSFAISHDAGATWTWSDTSGGGVITSNDQSVFVLEDQVYVGAFSDGPDSPGGVSISQDEGQTWRIAANFSAVYSVFALNPATAANQEEN
jgi:photosystem II stability/assembly factor-like uncharacterized protein